jgi:hypothetical protein
MQAMVVQVAVAVAVVLALPINQVQVFRVKEITAEQIPLAVEMLLVAAVLVL